MVGILFFLLVLFAAVTSSIALTESAVSTFEDELGWSRKKRHGADRPHHGGAGHPFRLGYGPLAGVTVFGMQFLDFFDFLTNSVMMPIAAIATCLLVSRVIGVEKIEEEVTLGRQALPPKKIFNFHDPVSLPHLCSHHPGQLCGKCSESASYGTTLNPPSGTASPSAMTNTATATQSSCTGSVSAEPKTAVIASPVNVTMNPMQKLLMMVPSPMYRRPQRAAARKGRDSSAHSRC